MIVKNFSVLTICSILIGVVLGITAALALRFINQDNFQIFKDVIKSEEFKDFLEDY